MVPAIKDRLSNEDRRLVDAQPRRILRILTGGRIWPLLGLATVILLAVAVIILYFPFSEKSVVQSLRETFPSEINIADFETLYFPHPGCIARGVTFRSTVSTAQSPAMVNIQKLTIQGSYVDFFLRPHHIAKVILGGLRFRIPPLGNAGAFNGGYTNSRMTIGEIVANGAVVEFAGADGKPAMQFDIHELSLSSVSAKEGMYYRVTMQNPAPPGEIKSTGHFGPFHGDHPGETPVSGSYSFARGDLGVFHGISGIFDSQGTFSGQLRKVGVQGTTEVPDFEVVRSGHAARLSTRFQLAVNALNGDVILAGVNASYFSTAISANGSVADKEGWDKKFTSLDFSVRDGRIQDVLRLFVSENQPPMGGVTNFQAHVTVPPEGKPFLTEVTLQGEFDIADGHFVKPNRQASVNELSKTARGQKDSKAKEKQDIPSEDVAAHVHGHADVRKGVATFADLTFMIPGADATMHGTFNLLDEKIDLHGTVKMDAKFSQSTSGIKAVFAKVLDPFLDKKHGSVVPVLVDGTYRRPHFGLDLNPIKK